MTEPFLAIRGIAKSFGHVVAVEDVTIDIAQGEFVTFLGPSGSGKSTTLYAIAGFLVPTRGDVLLQGKSLLRKPPNKRDIGMVFQRYTLFSHLSVYENVAFPLRVRRRPAAEIEAKVRRMLELVRLDSMADRMPATMSGGQQQRVALARALAYDPPILLMDEPLSALDKMLREEIQQEIKRIHKETGVTILYVTHDQEEALHLSDRVALFNNGRLEQIGSGQDLYERPASRFVAGFIGDSNFLDGKYEGRADGGASVRLPDGRRIVCGAGRHDAKGCEDITIMIRPDQLALKSGTDDGEGLVGTLADVVFLGSQTRLSVATPWGANVSARLPSSTACKHDLRLGMPVALACDPERVHLIGAA